MGIKETLREEEVARTSKWTKDFSIEAPNIPCERSWISCNESHRPLGGGIDSDYSLVLHERGNSLCNQVQCWQMFKSEMGLWRDCVLKGAVEVSNALYS